MNLKNLEKRLRDAKKKSAAQRKKERAKPFKIRTVRFGPADLFNPEGLKKSVRAHIARQKRLRRELREGKLPWTKTRFGRSAAAAR